MTPNRANTPATDEQPDSTSNKKPAAKKAKLETVPECHHSVFRFTPKRARQICTGCGAVRRISLKGDRTATVGPWRQK